MTLYFKGNQKYDRSNLKTYTSTYKAELLTLTNVIFLIPSKLRGHTVPHLKFIIHGKYETRGLSCGSTSSICQEILKSDNLLHKRGFADS